MQNVEYFKLWETTVLKHYDKMWSYLGGKKRWISFLNITFFFFGGNKNDRVKAVILSLYKI